jgi:hypothetical protein
MKLPFCAFLDFHDAVVQRGADFGLFFTFNRQLRWRYVVPNEGKENWKKKKLVKLIPRAGSMIFWVPIINYRI